MSIKPLSPRVRLTAIVCAILCSLAIVGSGCRSARQTGGDPFANRPSSTTSASQTPPTAPPPGTSIGQSNPVVPAGLEQPISPNSATQGLTTKSPYEDIEEVKSPFWDVLESLKPKNTWRGLQKMIGQGPDDAKARAAYAKGESLFKEKQYKEAAGYFKTAYKRAPDTPIEEDAMFMRAESLFFADYYSKASDNFSNLLKKYENSRYLDTAIKREFAIARYWEGMAPKRTKFLNFTDKTQPVWDNHGNAIAIYDAIHMHDPLGPLADDAAMASANNYFLRGDWENAATGYDTVRKFHSDSPFQPQAHLLGMRAKLNCYQGPQYEGKMLRQADELADQTLVQFSEQLPGERERLLQVKKTVRDLRAQREYESGEYYYRTKYYRAAGYYYRAVLKDYPETAYAELAQKRLEETKDLPPEPKQYFVWLVKLLSTHKD